MSEFKVGDRVKTPERGFSFDPIIGRIIRFSSGEGFIVRIPEGTTGAHKTDWLYLTDELTLINEDKMTYTDIQIRDALSDSVTHWREIVGVFGDTKTGDRLARPSLEGDDCGLCRLFHRAHGGSGDCGDCVLDKCGTETSTYGLVRYATNNHDAWVASKAMLARLEELLAEYDAKCSENDIRVGDIVAQTQQVVNNGVAICELKEVISVENGRCSVRYHKGLTPHNAPSSWYTVLYRPAPKGK